jgi:hypothetical protein
MQWLHIKPQCISKWEVYSENCRLCTLRSSSTSNDATIGFPKGNILSMPQLFTKEWMAITANNCRK